MTHWREDTMDTNAEMMNGVAHNTHYWKIHNNHDTDAQDEEFRWMQKKMPTFRIDDREKGLG